MEHKLLAKDADKIIDQILEIAMEFDFSKRMKMYREVYEDMFKNLIDWNSELEGSDM